MKKYAVIYLTATGEIVVPNKRVNARQIAMIIEDIGYPKDTPVVIEYHDVRGKVYYLPKHSPRWRMEGRARYYTDKMMEMRLERERKMICG